MFIASVGESRGPGERHHAVSGQSESWPGETSREEQAYTHSLTRSGGKKSPQSNPLAPVVEHAKQMEIHF